MEKNKKHLKSKLLLNSYSLTEILIVLAIIGILIMLALPNQTSVVAQAKSIEAQTMLNHLYGLEKNYFYRFSKYESDLQKIGFEPVPTLDEGGQAVYKIEVVKAGTNFFKARATAVSDFDGDGNFNTWEIDQNNHLVEVIKD